MIKIVNDKITPVLAHVETNVKTNKNGDPYAVHQIFPFGEDKTVDYAKTPKKVYPLCTAYTDSDTAFDQIGAVTISTIETVYPNQNSSLFCKINQANTDVLNVSAPVLIIGIPYRGSLEDVRVPDVTIKKALIVSTTPFKYMDQKCEFNKILYLVACAPDEKTVVFFTTAAIHRDDKTNTVEIYTRKHQAVIVKNDAGDYILESLEIVSQEKEKKNAADLENNKKSITEIVDISVNDVQKAEEKPKYNGNKKPYDKKKDDGEKKYDGGKPSYKNKPYKKAEEKPYNPTDAYRSAYTDKDGAFKLDFAARDEKSRKTNRRRNKSKSRYDY